jgi:hypothetical protein
MLGFLILKDINYDQELINVFFLVMPFIVNLIVFLNWILM